MVADVFQGARIGYKVYKLSRTPGGRHAQRVIMRKYFPRSYNRRVRRDFKYRHSTFYNKYFSIHP